MSHYFIVVVVAVFLLPIIPNTSAQRATSGSTTVVLEDFESYSAGDSPNGWKRVDGRKLIDVEDSLIVDDDYFEINSEDGNAFATVNVNDESTQIVLPRGHGYSWSLKEHKVLSWDWRAHVLPDGATERRESLNDTGGAVYVTFSRDVLGRPRIIKYTYSSSLPVDSVVRYGRLVVIVASSALDPIGSWLTVERNVEEDYQRVFSKNPPDEPLAVALWGDSDDTNTTARVDFDNITLRAEITAEEAAN